MSLTHSISKLGRSVKIFLESKNASKANLLAEWHGAGNAALVKEFDFSNNGLLHIKSGNVFSKSTLRLFNHNLELLELCCCTFNAIEKNGRLHLYYDDVVPTVEAIMQTHESILCFDEIFRAAAYSFGFSNSCVVIDGGMNIGIASLFFASRQMVDAVYGYEIVEGSFSAARENFSLNPLLEKKICPFHAALGVVDGETLIAKTGAGDVGANILNSDNVVAGQRVKVKMTSEVVKIVKAKHPLCKIVLKLDCEGSEYDLVDHLEKTGTLGSIDCMLIEWHFNGSSKIAETLIRHGFTVFTPNLKAYIPVGYIYASKC